MRGLFLEKHGYTRILVDGVTTEEEAESAAHLGADYVMVRMCGNEDKTITVEQCRNIKNKLNKDIIYIGRFNNAEVKDIYDLCKEGLLDGVYLAGDENETYIRELRRLLREQDKLVLPFIIKEFDTRKGNQYNRLNASAADIVALNIPRNKEGGYDYSIKDRIVRPYMIGCGMEVEDVEGAMTNLTATAFMVKDASRLRDYVIAVRKIN